jgi:hypothetical protein
MVHYAKQRGGRPASKKPKFERLYDFRGRVDDQAFSVVHEMRRGGATFDQIAQQTNLSSGAIAGVLTFDRSMPPSKRLAQRGPRKIPRALSRKIARRRSAVAKIAKEIKTHRVGKRTRRSVLYPSVKKIKAELGRRHPELAVGPTTVYTDLIASGMTNRVRPLVSESKPGDNANRLAFAKQHLDADKAEHNHFSDEKYFSLDDNGVRTQWVMHDVEPLTRERSQASPKVHVWAVFGAGFKFLVIIKKPQIPPAQRGAPPKDPQRLRAYLAAKKAHHDVVADAKKNSRVTALTYQGTLRKYKAALAKLPKSVRDKIVFMQDGASAHTAASTLKFIRDELGVQLMVGWPARSPQLNPTENLWSVM